MKDEVLSEGEENKALTWEEVSVEHLIKDEYIDFRRSDYRMPDGKVYGPYYTYSRRDYCIIVAQEEDGRFPCVRQFRQGVRRITTEFPAGGIERKDGRQYAEHYSVDGKAYIDRSSEEVNGPAGREDALEAAIRELKEETGYEAAEWKELLTIASNATIADNYAHIYLATGCKKVAGLDLDEMEFLSVHHYTEEEIDGMIAENRFEQAIHMLAWLLAKKELKKD